jgi:hypothetical protein
MSHTVCIKVDGGTYIVQYNGDWSGNVEIKGARDDGTGVVDCSIPGALFRSLSYKLILSEVISDLEDMMR